MSEHDLVDFDTPWSSIGVGMGSLNHVNKIMDVI